MTITHATSFTDARSLNRSIEALGVEVPRVLVDIVAGFDALAELPTPTDSSTAIVRAAVAGELDHDLLNHLVLQAALDKTVSDYRGQLRLNTERLFLVAYDKALHDGAADQVIDALRPQVDAASATIQAAREFIDIRMSAEDFIASAGPDQLAAYQSLAPAISQLNEVSAVVVRHFGMRSITFPQVLRPVAAGETQWIEDNALFFTDDLGWLRACDVFRAQEGNTPRESKWLRIGIPRLSTVAEAREKLRAWAEGAWRQQQGDNLDDERERLNPFRIPEPDEPHVSYEGSLWGEAAARERLRA
jgi:hypothetical protein